MGCLCGGHLLCRFDVLGTRSTWSCIREPTFIITWLHCMFSSCDDKRRVVGNENMTHGTWFICCIIYFPWSIPLRVYVLTEDDNSWMPSVNKTKHYEACTNIRIFYIRPNYGAFDVRVDQSSSIFKLEINLATNESDAASPYKSTYSWGALSTQGRPALVEVGLERFSRAAWSSAAKRKLNRAKRACRDQCSDTLQHRIIPHEVLMSKTGNFNFMQ